MLNHAAQAYSYEKTDATRNLYLQILKAQNRHDVANIIMSQPLDKPAHEYVVVNGSQSHEVSVIASGSSQIIRTLAHIKGSQDEVEKKCAELSVPGNLVSAAKTDPSIKKNLIISGLIEILHDPEGKFNCKNIHEQFDILRGIILGIEYTEDAKLRRALIEFLIPRVKLFLDLRSDSPVSLRYDAIFACFKILEIIKIYQASLPAETQALGKALRAVIISVAKKRAPQSLEFAMLTNFPGLSEECAFLMRPREHRSIKDYPLYEVELPTLDGEVIKGAVGQLHATLLRESRREDLPPPVDVLDRLRAEGVEEISALYQYWYKRWDQTHGETQRTEEREKIRQQAEYTTRATQALKAEHEALLTRGHQVTKSNPAPGVSRTGAAQAALDPASDESSGEEAQSPGYNGLAALAEAVRRARESVDAISEDIKNSLFIVAE
ncbi:MAG: hypothetical protein Q8K36_04955, partial [Alphaproteobacteria bacterium]|nr:hypothetical protein [Alphaproteobacteria bacterium]